MENKILTFDLFSASYAICRLHAKAPFPGWVTDSEIILLTRTPDEVSVVCAEILVPKGIIAERDMRVMRIKGPIDFGVIGILSSVSKLFADTNISIFAFSTYDTDYFLVKEKDLNKALAALYKAGHTVVVLNKEKAK